MEKLARCSSLIVRQKKEWGEIFTGFEGKNKYEVMDEAGAPIYYAAEEGGNLLLRWFLKANRPFTMAILTREGESVLRVKRPFRFYFHEAKVLDAQGDLLGTIKRNFAIIRRKYTVTLAADKREFQLFGPLLHPWTFEVREGGREQGKITKKWSGLFKESISDADNFGVTVPVDWSAPVKAVFLGAVFLIDFVHFENKGE